MPVLIVAVAVVVVLVVAVAWVLVGYATRQRESEQIEARLVGQAFTAVEVGDAFDPEFAAIWETQLPALQLVSAAGAKGLAVERLYGFYLASAHAYPELYDGSSFYDWLEFLERSRLIGWRNDRIVLTHEGREFYAHLSATTALV
jgi:hypothetical protein